MESEIQAGETAVLQNGDVMNDNDLAMNELQDPSKPIRIVKRAKRSSRSNSEGDSSTNGNTYGSHENAKINFSKNSRKSRDGRGKGEPKKGNISFFLNLSDRTSIL